MFFQAQQKIVFIGDSITDAGRREEAYRPYGYGYVSQVHSLLLARYPELHLTVVNKGIGGNTVLDLQERWQSDVIAEQPHWLSVKIGINDAYRKVPLEQYRATLHALLEQTRRETEARLILLHPFLIYKDPMHRDRQQQAPYIAVVDELAREFDAVRVETQAAFDIALQETQESDWAADHVHPGGPGHAVIALAFLRAIGFEL